MARIIMNSASLASVFVLLLCVCPSSSQSTSATTNGTDPTMQTIMVTSDDNSTMTANMTTVTDMTTMTSPTTTTTTTTTTTPTPVVSVGHNGMAFYTIHFTVGPTNTSDIMYMGNKTQMELEMELMEAFMNVSAADISLMSMDDHMMGQEDDHMMMMTYTLRILFLSSHINNHTAMDLMDAIAAVGMMETYNVPHVNMTNDRIAEFASMTDNVCEAEMVCPVGFRCVAEGCENLCQQEDCNGHGTCVVSVMANGTATTICQCDESYDTEYYGHRCEKDRRGKEQIIAIIAAVLGVAVLLLIILLIVMCCLYFRRTHDAYDMKGRGYKNNAYDGVQD